MLYLLDSVQLKGRHVVLQLVLGGREHNRRHHFEVVVCAAVVDNDVEEVGINLKLQACAGGVCFQLLVDVATHEADLARHTELWGLLLALIGWGLLLLLGGLLVCGRVVLGGRCFDSRDQYKFFIKTSDLLLR